MENRDLITRKELVSCVEAVKMDISKGLKIQRIAGLENLVFQKMQQNMRMISMKEKKQLLRI